MSLPGDIQRRVDAIKPCFAQTSELVGDFPRPADFPRGRVERDPAKRGAVEDVFVVLGSCFAADGEPGVRVAEAKLLQTGPGC